MSVGAWVVFGTLFGVYWVNQVLRTEEFGRQADNNRRRSVPITAPRGFILDRYGAVLVENEPSFTLLLYRRETKDLESSLRLVATLLDRPIEELRRRAERDRSVYDFVPVVLEENLTLEEVGSIEAHGLEHPEFVIQAAQRRVYKEGTTAAHLLGYLGEATPEHLAASGGRLRPGDSTGLKGVEAVYQNLLSGFSGARTFVIDSFGREVTELDRVDPTPGSTLYLTIDLELQRIAKDYFRDRVGSAVALDPKTGEVLALVSAPEFDPNLFSRRVSRKEWEEILANQDRPLNNRVLQNVYSPGSVWKAFVAYGVLADGISAAERVFCGGASTFYGRSFRCHGAHGSVDLPTALQVSCDVYFYTMGKRLGIEHLAETARLFGFGSPTGIDLPSEKGGTVPSPLWSLQVRKIPWYPGETISVAIGQGPLLVSALQVARGFAALANRDGSLPTPHLFHMSRDERTQERVLRQPSAGRSVPFRPGMREAIVEGLHRVVNAPGGTAFAVRVPDLDICGKTGTVQVVGQKDTKKAHLLPDHLKDHGWFAAFAPRDDPKIVVVVFVEHGEHGNSAAAPLAAKLCAAYLKRQEPDEAPGRPREVKNPGTEVVAAPSPRSAVRAPEGG